MLQSPPITYLFWASGTVECPLNVVVWFWVTSSCILTVVRHAQSIRAASQISTVSRHDFVAT
jgi:hypothetical protein